MDIHGVPHGERRLSASEKGKGRAADFTSTVKGNGYSFLEHGRSKRVRKKRRLSASGEIDPIHLNDDGSIKRTTASTSKVHIRELPMSAEDELYFARLDQNARRPALNNWTNACPLWAKTRSAFQATTDHFQRPIRTAGATVNVDQDGVARGVILEGQAPGQRNFFSMEEEAGIILVSM